jgi:hypothetical protein
MNAKPAFLNDGLDFGESVFRRVIRLERTTRDKPGAQGREHNRPEERLVGGIERAIDEDVPGRGRGWH